MVGGDVKIIFLRGATAWEFAIGRLYWRVTYPKYWNIVSGGWDRT